MAPLSTRLCEGCRKPIAAERLKSVPDSRQCVECQTKSEKEGDTRRYVNEGLAGTREDHKKMRGKQWSEMIQRSRGK
jgi:RNA polymerase-binding transcription factor DksA